MYYTKKNNPSKTKTTITFYMLHLPVLLVVLGVLAFSALVSFKALPKKSEDSLSEQPLGYVLGDDDDEKESKEDNKHEDDKDDDEDDNKDEDDDKDDEDEDKDEDKDDDRDDDKDEDEDDDKDDDNDFENEFELEVEDELENKVKTQNRIQNSDGTYSIVKTETEGDKVKIESKTYDASGKLIREEKHEGSDEGFESETEDSTGNKLKIRVQDTETLIKKEGISGLQNFPLFVNEADGSVYVQTPKGDVKLGVMPQAIIEKAESSEDVDDIEEVELETDAEDKLEFKLKTKKAEKLFGIFELEIPSTVYYDAQDGEELRSEKTFITRVLDFFSF
ncbi:MAG: hypothetical protein ACOZAO_00670 [Patescibacteria group bacterium]